MNQKLGRRRCILIAAAIFTVGSVLLGFAPNYTILVLGRIILGVGIGIASLTTPIYIAEVALPHMRGQLVTINTLMITFGQFFAGMVDGVLDEYYPTEGWRFMLGLAALPSILMFMGFLYLPESPRWLASKGLLKEAAQVLYTLRATTKEAEEELQDIQDTLPSSQQNSTDQRPLDYGSDDTSSDSSSSPSISDSYQNSVGSSDEGNDGDDVLIRFVEMVSHEPTRRALILGCGLMAVQQFSGINTVMYYAASIYEMSGFDELTAVWLSGFTALAQVVGIATSIFLVDRGRSTNSGIDFSIFCGTISDWVGNLLLFVAGCIGSCFECRDIALSNSSQPPFGMV